MPRLAKGQISKHPTKGYRVSVGTYLKDGVPTEKVFWLGQDYAAAHCAADVYRSGWAQLCAVRHEHWTDQWVATAKATIAANRDRLSAAFEWDGIQRRQVQNAAAAQIRALDQSAERLGLADLRAVVEPAPSTTSAAPATANTLYATIDAYIAVVNSKRHSDSHKWRVEKIVRTSLKRLREDCPLSQIDYVWLDRLCDYCKGRPASLKNGETGGFCP